MEFLSLAHTLPFSKCRKGETAMSPKSLLTAAICATALTLAPLSSPAQISLGIGDVGVSVGGSAYSYPVYQQYSYPAYTYSYPAYPAYGYTWNGYAAPTYSYTYPSYSYTYYY